MLQGELDRGGRLELARNGGFMSRKTHLELFVVHVPQPSHEDLVFLWQTGLVGK